jgi:hypothetical protein
LQGLSKTPPNLGFLRIFGDPSPAVPWWLLDPPIIDAVQKIEKCRRKGFCSGWRADGISGTLSWAINQWIYEKPP